MYLHMHAFKQILSIFVLKKSHQKLGCSHLHVVAKILAPFKSIGALPSTSMELEFHPILSQPNPYRGPGKMDQLCCASPRTPESES